MNLAFLLRSKSVSSLQSWACGWVFGREAIQAPGTSSAIIRSVGTSTLRPVMPTVQTCVQIRRPLRVVRVIEIGQPRAYVGRMVISGRMSDVCAELDRLAAREAADNCCPRGV